MTFSHTYCCSALCIVTAKVPPAVVVTDIPCMLAPSVQKLLPGLLENGGSLPRNAENQVTLPGLQHIGARGHDFPDLHEVRVSPRGFPSATASSASATYAVEPVGPIEPALTIYAAYAAAHPMPGVQAHVDVRTLLRRAADVAEENSKITAAGPEGGAIGDGNRSSSPKRISELAENTLSSLHGQGRYAMTLFEVVLVYAVWFQAAGVTAPVYEAAAPVVEAPGADGDGRAGEGDAPPDREIADMSRSELLMIAEHFMLVLRAAIGSTEPSGTSMTAPEFMKDELLFSEGEAGCMVLRDVGDVVKLYHQVNLFPKGLFES